MKSIVVFSSVLFLSIAAFFQSAGVTVTTNLPSNVKPGNAFDLTVTVSKGQMSSFSKFQMTFPAGFTVEEVDVKGGTFSFVDQNVKIIWVSLPADAQFDVKLKVSTTQIAKGAHELKGSFSYIYEGARNDATCAYKIEVSDQVPENIATAPVAPVQPSVPSSPITPAFRMIRTLSANEIEAGKMMEVTLEVTKEGISGFGKLTEVIPEGFTAEAKETNGAIFSVVNREVRFLWMTLPADRTFSVVYRLTANEPIGEKTIKGTFSYIEDDKTRLNSTSASSLKVLPKPVIAAAPEEPAESTPSDQESSSVASAPKTEEVELEASQETESVVAPLESVASAETPQTEKAVEESVETTTESTEQPVASSKVNQTSAAPSTPSTESSTASSTTTSSSSSVTATETASAASNAAPADNASVSYRVQI